MGSSNLPGVYGLVDVLPEVGAGTVPVVVAGVVPVGEFLSEGVEPCGCAGALDPEGLDAFPDLVDRVMM